MGRQKDNAPIGITCPLIDDVIAFIETLRDEHLNEDNDADFTEVFKLMEKIRTANSSLREWGNEEYQRAEDLDDENSDLKRDIKDLQNEIYDLKREIESLQDSDFNN